MNSRTERIVGASFSLGCILSLYFYLKLTGNIPGPGWWIVNDIDYYLVKIFHILKYAAPILIFTTLSIMFFRKFKMRKEALWQEQMNEERKHERILHEKQKKEEELLFRLGNIENELKKVNEGIGQSNKRPAEVSESVLQEFL